MFNTPLLANVRLPANPPEVQPRTPLMSRIGRAHENAGINPENRIAF
jgi:hypothetical protein